MKKLLLLAVVSVVLSGCGTPYHADFSEPKGLDGMTNPYQQPVPNDGAASLLKNIISHLKGR